MPFSAVLDANVLYPFSLRDTLLRLAELELYTPLWSDRILDEMTRNLVEHRLTDAQAASINQAMRFAFEEAEVDAGEVERLEPAMTNEAKDRHVLAAASPPIRNWSSPSTSTTSRPKLASRSASRRSTPTTSCSTSTTSPPEAVRAALEQQAADLHPPWPLEQLLEALATAGVPRFVATVRSQT
jgi:hypothetical protein